MLAAASKGVSSSCFFSSGVDSASDGAFAVSVFLFVILSLCSCGIFRVTVFFSISQDRRSLMLPPQRPRTVVGDPGVASTRLHGSEMQRLGKCVGGCCLSGHSTLVNHAEDALPARKGREACGEFPIVSESIIRSLLYISG